jgi:hypothetical protein
MPKEGTLKNLRWNLSLSVEGREFLASEDDESAPIRNADGVCEQPHQFGIFNHRTKLQSC